MELVGAAQLQAVLPYDARHFFEYPNVNRSVQLPDPNVHIHSVASNFQHDATGFLCGSRRARRIMLLSAFHDADGPAESHRQSREGRDRPLSGATNWCIRFMFSGAHPPQRRMIGATCRLALAGTIPMTTFCDLIPWVASRTPVISKCVNLCQKAIDFQPL